MAQVVVQDFQLEGIPQATPRAAKYPIDKLAPQLTKGRFHLLAYLAEDEAMSRGLVPGNQQHLGFFRQVRCTLGPAIAQVTQGDTSVYGVNQGQGGSPVIPIPGRQDHIEHASFEVPQQVQFEAKEPPFARFSKVGPLVAQPPRTRPWRMGRQSGRGLLSIRYRRGALGACVQVVANNPLT
jgi:hypothetical protein